MLMRPQAQIAKPLLTTAAQLVCIGNLELLQHLACVQWLEFRVGCAEGLGNGFVFLRQDGASGVNQTATRLDQACASAG